MIHTSIIIPTYKRAAQLKKCLEFIGKSDGLNSEFSTEIIVVDSSPDNEIEKVLDEFSDIFSIKYIHQKERTYPGVARNIAIEEASNELIISIDSDIEVVEDTIINLIECLKENKSFARVTGFSKFAEDREQVDRPSRHDRILNKNGSDFIEGIYGRYEAFYKTPFQSVGGYDDLFATCGEGTDLSIRYWRAGFPLGFAKKAVAYHNTQAPDSLRRTGIDRLVTMYRSLVVVAYKFDINDPQVSSNFAKSYKEREDAHGEFTEFFSIVGAAQSMEWIAEKLDKIKKSKEKIPTDYDFKPSDVFTKTELLDRCISQAEEKISSSYNRTFAS